MNRLSKNEIEKEIEKFFKPNSIKKKTSKEAKKIKKLAMRYNIKLGTKRKLFCKKCHVFFNVKNSKTRIKKGKKIIRCLKCKEVSRWKIK